LTRVFEKKRRRKPAEKTRVLRRRGESEPPPAGRWTPAKGPEEKQGGVAFRASSRAAAIDGRPDAAERHLPESPSGGRRRFGGCRPTRRSRSLSSRFALATVKTYS